MFELVICVKKEGRFNVNLANFETGVAFEPFRKRKRGGSSCLNSAQPLLELAARSARRFANCARQSAVRAFVLAVAPLTATAAAVQVQSFVRTRARC